MRTALRPRMLALLALALLMAVVFAELGSWQLGRSRSGEQAPPERPVLPLQEVLAPQEQLSAEAVAGPVSVEGTWADQPQQLVVDRAPDGSPGDGAWVVAAVEVVDGGDGALLPVVRGWVPARGGAGGPEAAQEVPAPPTGAADLVGHLALSQDPRGSAGLPEGQLAAASSADLLNVWDGRIYAGYLVPDEPGPGLVAVPAPEPEGGANLQNLSYAFQWWVFAGFAVLMWLRVVADVRRRALERAEDEAEERRLEAAAPSRTAPVAPSRQDQDEQGAGAPHHPDRSPQEASR